MNFGNLTKIPI